MKYVKKFWIPVVLLIAFIAATVYTSRDPYPVAPDGQAQWVAERQQGFLTSLGSEHIDSSYLADSVTAEGGVEIQLWRFEVDGHFYNDILAWVQNSEGNYKLVYSYCIAQAAMEGPVEISFQDGLYQYQSQANEDLTLTQPTREFSLIAPLLCVVLVVIYVALTIAALWYRKNKPEKKAVKQDET